MKKTLPNFFLNEKVNFIIGFGSIFITIGI